MKKWKIICLLAAAILFLESCGGADGKDMTVVLTTGFRKDEVFRIDSVSCSLPEIMIYLTNTQNQYESVYGRRVWETDLNGMTLEQSVKDTVLARMAQVKSMTLLAERNGTELSEEEKGLAGLAAQEYFASLSEREAALMGADEDVVRGLYEEYALARKVYEQIIREINPEISDDEARIITVQHILFKTYTLDGTGRKVEYTDNDKASVYARASEVLALANDGQHDFESLAAQYSEDSVTVYSFGKGEMDPDFENAAFNLGNNEISGIVESEFGYHIIKCLNTFDREETDRNKLKIVEQRRQEVFGEEYDAFVESLIRLLNEELWDSVAFIHDPEVTTSDFFDIYYKYFSDKAQ